MSQPEIITFFPKTLYYKQGVMVDQLEYLYNTLHSLELPYFKDTSLSVNSSHKTFSSLHTLEPFKEFSNTILENAQEYGKILGYSQKQLDKFRFINMWFNQSFKGDFNFPHIHNGSVISGVFYIKTVPENKIVFQNMSDQIAEPENPSELAWNARWFTTHPGLLLLFKSDVVHSNPRQEDENEKLIISFNITMDL